MPTAHEIYIGYSAHPAAARVARAARELPKSSDQQR